MYNLNWVIEHEDEILNGKYGKEIQQSIVRILNKLGNIQSTLRIYVAWRGVKKLLVREGNITINFLTHVAGEIIARYGYIPEKLEEEEAFEIFKNAFLTKNPVSFRDDEFAHRMLLLHSKGDMKLISNLVNDVKKCCVSLHPPWWYLKSESITEEEYFYSALLRISRKE